MSKSIEEIYYHCRLASDPEKFWELNIEMSYLDPFAQFKEEENSAAIMTAIYMIYDPKSQLVNSGESESKIKKDVAKNFLGDENFNWKPYMKYVRSYKIFCKTKIEKALDDWWRQLQERNIFLEEEMEWDEENARDKDALLLKTKEHFQNYNEIKSLLKEERQEKLMYGDYTVSELESWAIDE